MNPWIAALIGAGAMYLVAVIITLIDEPWVDDKFTAPLEFLLEAIIFIPVVIWKFFRWTVVPISLERQKDKWVQSVIAESTRLTPTIYFHHDKKAKSWTNKFFLFRLEK